MYINEKLEMCKKYLNGKSASVIGVGISNIPLINFLLKNNVKVTARDKKSIDEISGNKDFDYKNLKKLGVEFITGEKYLDNINEDILFKTPGLRYDIPEIMDYASNGGVVTSEMELFLHLCPTKIFAVTGSDGKTTTTTLISKLLETTGKKVHIGGNIGKPLLFEIENILPDDYTVLELSSFQLHCLNKFENKDFPFHNLSFPDVAVLTNISPNHLNWHPDMEEYTDAKKAIFSFLKPGGKLITNYDCEITKGIGMNLRNSNGNVCFFSLSGNNSSDYVYKDSFIQKDGNLLLSSDDILVVGKHNIDNFMTAIAATEGYVSIEGIANVAKTFPGVEHRIEFVCEQSGVRYYNSSIDSSPTRTAITLNSFPEEKNIIILLGGYDKKIPFDGLGKHICKYAKAAFLTGPTANAIKNEIINCSEYCQNTTKLFMCKNWDEAIDSAKKYAHSGDIVLLSPACASFDAFRNFEERGNIFKEKVKGNI